MTWLYSIGITILIFGGIFIYVWLLNFMTSIITKKYVDNPDELDYIACGIILWFFSIILPIFVWCAHEIFFRK